MESKVVKSKKETLHRIDGKKESLGEKLSVLQLIYLWFSSLVLIQGSFNYAYFQGTGYSQCIYPWVRKIFKSNKDKLKETLINNIEFYNTGPALGNNIVAAIHISLLQNGAKEDEIRGIKFALMGPLAGINDALFNFGTQPLFAGIAAALSSGGSWSGFWFYMIVYNAVQFSVGIITTILTYRFGEKFIMNMSSTMSSIVKISSMIGITIIGALAITYTGINLKVESSTSIVSQGVFSIKITDYQSVINKLMPYAMPILLIGSIYLLMAKRNWSIYKVLMAILIFGIAGYVYGIF